jgi:hypothetical protein
MGKLRGTTVVMAGALLASWAAACDDGAPAGAGPPTTTGQDAAADGAVDLAVDRAPDLPVVAPDAVDGRPEPDSAGDGPWLTTRKLDLLFLVDDSGSMAEEQSNLARNFPALLRELSSAGADLHIAVVSSDLGAGPMSYSPACAPPGGDRGQFCSTKERDGIAVDTCARCAIDTSGGRFLRTINPNFMGDLPNSFACMAQLGTQGCGFEHQLGALRQALHAPENGQFLRADAALAIVILSDEDDCTAAPDSALFASDIPGQDSSLRCALQGHVCMGAHNSGTADVDVDLAQCQAASDGALVPVQQLVDAVVAAKSDPNLIFVAGIVGWPLPRTEANPRYRIGPAGNGGLGGTRTLRPVCQSNLGSATVGLRLEKFITSFPHHLVTSICQDDFTPALRTIGQMLGAAMP